MDGHDHKCDLVLSFMRVLRFSSAVAQATANRAVLQNLCCEFESYCPCQHENQFRKRLVLFFMQKMFSVNNPYDNPNINADTIWLSADSNENSMREAEIVTPVSDKTVAALSGLFL